MLGHGGSKVVVLNIPINTFDLTLLPSTIKITASATLGGKEVSVSKEIDVPLKPFLDGIVLNEDSKRNYLVLGNPEKGALINSIGCFFSNKENALVIYQLNEKNVLYDFYVDEFKNLHFIDTNDFPLDNKNYFTALLKGRFNSLTLSKMKFGMLNEGNLFTKHEENEIRKCIVVIGGSELINQDVISYLNTLITNWTEKIYFKEIIFVVTDPDENSIEVLKNFNDQVLYVKNYQIGEPRSSEKIRLLFKLISKLEY